MLGLERFQVLTGGDVVIVGFLGSLIALGDVRLDGLDQLLLVDIFAGGHSLSPMSQLPRRPCSNHEAAQLCVIR
jgi:hypothetical protein